MISNKTKRKLKRYIKRALSKGIDKETIKQQLSKIGWTEEILNPVFDSLKRKRFNIAIEKEEKKPEEKEEEKPLEEKPEEVKKEGIRDQITDLKEKMDLIIEKSRVKKGRPFRLPYRARSQLKTLAKKGKLLVFYLRQNRTIELFVSKIQRGFIEVDGKWHNCSMDFVFLWKGKNPAIILPEWDLNPIGTKQYYEAMKEGRKADPQDIVLRLIESIEAREKKKISPKAIFWFVIVGLAVAWVIFGGQIG